MNPLLALAGGSALLGAGASIFGSSKQARAAREAAELQAQAAAQARADMEPWRQAGLTALPFLTDAAAQPFGASEGYQFRLGEGLRGLNSTALAQGLYGSGARARAAQRFGQGLASEEYANWYNRLAQLAGLGQGAAGQTGQFGMAGAAGRGQMLANAGTAEGGGYVGAANALGGGMNNLLMLYALGGMGGGAPKLPMGSWGAP